MSTVPQPTPPNRNAPNPLFGATLMGVMVALIATTVLLVMYEWGWFGALSLGSVIGTVVVILLVLLLRRPLPPVHESADAFEPLVGRREGKGPVHTETQHGPQAQPRTTLEAATSVGTTGGDTIAAKPATPDARDPLDPAERPVPGAGGPVPAPPVANPPEGEVPPAQVGDPVIPVSDAPAVRISQGEAAPYEPEGVDTGTAPAPGAADPATRAPVAAPTVSAAAAPSEAAEAVEFRSPSVAPAPTAPETAEPETGGQTVPGSGDPEGVDPAMPGPGAQSGAPRAAAAAAAFEAAPEPAADAPAPGTKPELLDAPRSASGDDLKLIRGVGPKLEGMLHDLGVWHFDQIASWGPDEIAWVDANLEGFNGRIERDEWVSQARTLAAGGTTEVAGRQDDPSD